MNRSMRKWARLFGGPLVLFLSLMALPARGEPRVSIRLPSHVEVLGPAVTLGEVAELRTGDLVVLERLVSLPLGRAPRIGDSVILERIALEGWLAKRAGLEPRQIEWQGETKTQVMSALREIDFNEIVKTAQGSLVSWLSERATRFEVDPAVGGRPIRVPPGRLMLKPRPLHEGEAVRARMQVWVEVWVNDIFIHVVPVSFAVEAYGEALVAAAPTRAGESIALSALVRQEVRLEGAPSFKKGFQPVSAERLRARAALRAGEVVTAASIEAEPAVSRGKSARLVRNEGSMLIQSKVEVMQDGAPGDWVRVRLPASAGTVTARVLEPGVVEVRP
jgi:flagella basal body P-ring formation protein FlgA